VPTLPLCPYALRPSPILWTIYCLRRQALPFLLLGVGSSDCELRLLWFFPPHFSFPSTVILRFQSTVLSDPLRQNANPPSDWSPVPARVLLGFVLLFSFLQFKAPSPSVELLALRLSAMEAGFTRRYVDSLFPPSFFPPSRPKISTQVLHGSRPCAMPSRISPLCPFSALTRRNRETWRYWIHAM